jgi:hypothetical protein
MHVIEGDARSSALLFARLMRVVRQTIGALAFDPAPGAQGHYTFRCFDFFIIVA